MKCEEIKKILLDYQWGELSEEEAKEVREHLSGCPACVQYEKELRGLLNLMSRVEEEELSERPYLFLKSRVEKLGLRDQPSWVARIRSLFRYPIPVYRVVFIALSLAGLAWFGGNLTGRRVEQSGAPYSPAREVRVMGAPQHPDTHISFVATPTVWTRVHSPDTIPRRPKIF